MAKIIISNFITFTLVFSWFTFFSSTQHHKDFVDDPKAIKKLITGLEGDQVQSDITTVNSHFEKGEKPQLTNELGEAESFKKYYVNDDDWSDIYLKFHAGTVEHEGSKIKIVDIYKGFYKEAFRQLKNYYPSDGEERMLTLLTLKYYLLREKEKLTQDTEMKVKMIKRDFDQKISAIKNNDDLSDEKKEQLVENLEFERDLALYDDSASPSYTNEQKRQELDMNHAVNIRKVLGSAYSDIQESLKSYNNDLYNKYGNYYYSF